MKILVLHGDYSIKSYNRLQEIIDTSKKRGWEIQRVTNGDSLSLQERLTAKSLFGNKSLYVVDDINKLQKKEIRWLKKTDRKTDEYLVLYAANIVGKRLLNSLPRGYKVEEFKLPKLIWKFLDSFYPKNARSCLRLLHEVIETEPSGFVFALLARSVRDLYWVTIDSKSINYPNWRVGKLERQAEKFTNGQLKVIISALAEADIKAKTSKVDIIDSLDFLIATHLE